MPPPLPHFDRMEKNNQASEVINQLLELFYIVH